MLNTAEGKKTGLVDTNEDYYYRYGIKYMGLKLFDVAQTNISKHFIDVSDYIDEALNEGGKSSIFSSDLKILLLDNILLNLILFVEIPIPYSFIILIFYV